MAQGNLANYLEEKLLSHVLKGVSYSTPTIYVGLVNSSATEAELEGGVLTNEITGYNGDRKTVTFTDPVQEGDAGTVYNQVDIDFENMPIVSIGYVILCDSATAGNVLFYAPADTIKTSNAGDTYRIPANNLKVTLD